VGNNYGLYGKFSVDIIGKAVFFLKQQDIFYSTMLVAIYTIK
jgi:hypothetical protein